MQVSIPKREDVDLHELERIDVVLVPFDHLAVDHRGRLDRHQVVEPVVGQHEAARMLAEMPRRAHQLARQIERQAQAPVDEVEVQLLDVLRPRRPPPTSPRPGTTAS